MASALLYLFRLICLSHWWGLALANDFSHLALDRRQGRCIALTLSIFLSFFLWMHLSWHFMSPIKTERYICSYLRINNWLSHQKCQNMSSSLLFVRMLHFLVIYDISLWTPVDYVVITFWVLKYCLGHFSQCCDSLQMEKQSHYVLCHRYRQTSVEQKQQSFQDK